jgi:ABC-type transport system involved in cytochrome bd biosynthesis fused ATPase/permease subunit
MHEGRVAEEGTHAELLALKGKYAELWSMQSDEDGVGLRVPEDPQPVN